MTKSMGGGGGVASAPFHSPPFKNWIYFYDTSFPPGYESQTLPKVGRYLVCTQDSATVNEPCINYVREHTTVYRVLAHSQEDGLIDTVSEKDLLPRVMTPLMTLNLKFDEMRSVVPHLSLVFICTQNHRVFHYSQT